LIAYCQQAAAEHILLITTDKLDAAVLKSQWMLALDKVGVIVQVWPLQGAELQDWLLRRAARKGMKLEADAVKALAARVEGNLLAAAQEIEKLYILHGASTIGRAKVDDLVADSARFDVFKLTDALLQGKLQRSLKILQALKAEDVAAPIVLWALSREIRLLLALQTAGHQPGIYKKYQVTERRRPLLEKALSRLKLRDLQDLLQCCAITDLQIKGELSGDCWESLLSLCWMLVDPAVTDRYVRFA